MAVNMRKIKVMLLSARHWRKRLVFWSGALLVGVTASFFAMAADRAQAIFIHTIGTHIFYQLAVLPLGFGLAAWLTVRYVPAARGSGIPQVIAARILRDGESRRKLIGLRTGLGKIVLTLLVMLCGASVGREGPTVQIGAAIMLACAYYGGLAQQRGVVLAGAAAGVAAAFNTPLAGIVFAIEEMARAFEHRNSSIVLIAIVFAGAASMSLLGNYNYFGYTSTQLGLLKHWQAVLTIGLAGGLCGGLFARFLIGGEEVLRKWAKKSRIGHPAIFAALCGLGVAVLGIASGGMVYGSGYEMGRALLHQEISAEWWQMPSKLAATALSAISGIPGGIFSPSLSVGAAMGAQMAPWLADISISSAVILGMVAYFAGVTQAPITAFVIVLEITGKATDAVPLIAAAVLAASIGRFFCEGSLYHELAKRFLTDERKK